MADQHRSAILSRYQNTADMTRMRVAAERYQRPTACQTPNSTRRPDVAQRTYNPIDVANWNDQAQARMDTRTRWVPATGCLIYTGTSNQYGYCQIMIGGRNVYVHRLTWTLANGPIPDGLELDHLCRVPNCINTDHLEPVTHRENMLRGNTLGARESVKTHCPAGHALTPGNLRHDQQRVGKRACLTCARQKSIQRNQVLGQAARIVGLTQRQYGAQYGYKVETAQAIISGVAS